MDRLYELGKRFERLLYSSILVIIASCVTYSLLGSLLTYESLELLNTYKIIKQNIELKKDSIIELDGYLARVIKDRKVEPKSRSGALMIKEGYDTKKIEEEKLKENETFNIYKNIINRERKALGLKEANSLSETEGYLIEIVKNMLDDPRIKFNALIKMKYDILDNVTWHNYNDLILWLNKGESELSQNKIEVANIETPITIPFTIGDVKSNIPLMNIAKTSIFIMPLFMVIWLGSISITRSFEINSLKKTKDLTFAYPHLLNVFYIEEGESNLLQMAIIGDEEKKSEILKTLKTASYIRISMYLLLIASMCIPLYIGAFNYIFDSDLQITQYVMTSVCMAINIFQAVLFCVAEWRLSDRVYVIKNGFTKEYVIKTN